MNVKSSLPFSAVIICYNSAEVIEKCLQSLNFADEIVLIDSGSNDDTLEIAAKYGCNIIQKEWLGFGAQKQFGVEAARYDWVLCLDSDEMVSNELRQQIGLTLQNPKSQGYLIPRCNIFLGRYLRFGEGYPDLSLRLFDRRFGRWLDLPVHEYVKLNGLCGKIKGDILHDTARSLSVYINKQNRYTDLAAAEYIRSGRKLGLLRLIISPLWRFVKFYIIKQGWRDGWQGFIHIKIGCQNSFNKYAKIYAEQND